MAKLNLNALSQASNTQEVEKTISTTVEAIGETLQESPSKKPRISLKNGKISSISHQEIVQAVEEKSVSEEVVSQIVQITQTPVITLEEVKKTPARISLKKQKEEIIEEEKKEETKQKIEAISEETFSQEASTAITQEISSPVTSEISEEKVEEVKNFVIQDADTQVEITHHQRKELFTNYAGSYAKEEPKKEEAKVPEMISQVEIAPVSEITPEVEIIEEKITPTIAQTQNEQTQNTRITNEATPLQNIQKTQKFKKPLIAALGTLSLCVIGWFAFMNLNWEKITGNVQEIPPVSDEVVVAPVPTIAEVEITPLPPEPPMWTPEELNQTNEIPNTPETPTEIPTEINNISEENTIIPPPQEQPLETATLTQNTQTGNVNTNTSSDVDNKEKNDKIKDEVKKYLLKKYKPN